MPILNERAIPGTPLQIPAATYNAMRDAAVAHQQQAPAGGGKTAARSRTPLISVYNDSGETLPWLSAVRVSTPIVTPTCDETVFKLAVVVKVVKPTADSEGRWVVLAQPLGVAEFGSAVAQGVTPCKINLLATSDTFVEVAASNLLPQGGASGSAQILWVAGGVGSATATGEQFALIKLVGAAATLPSPQYPEQYAKGLVNNRLGFGFIKSHPPLTA